MEREFQELTGLADELLREVRLEPRLGRPVPVSAELGDHEGLAERRGRPVAVIDLPSLLDASPAEPPRTGHLMRLSGALEGDEADLVRIEIPLALHPEEDVTPVG